VTYRIIFTTPALRAEEIIARAESLRSMPTRQRERSEIMKKLRALHVDGYLLFYRVRDDKVFILRILHGSRNITAKLFPRPR
jgi:plasmid stabilization system protein ParE